MLIDPPMIDFMQGYTTQGAPLFAPGVVSAVAESVELPASARQHGIAVMHPHIRYHAGHFVDGGIWVKKAPVMKDMVEGNPLAAFCAEVLPQADEVVITKQYASAFFGSTWPRCCTPKASPPWCWPAAPPAAAFAPPQWRRCNTGFAPSLCANESASGTRRPMKPTCSISTASTATW
ncbi:putative isochorismatase [Pseudomonas sp. CF161]|nr:putative isochorismatase [Pseudomonas sp. CF161]